METADSNNPAQDAPAPPETWDTLGLSQAALELVRKAGFTKPTSIQTQAIPPGLEGKDLIASSQTGTGKTAGFVLPMVEKFAGKEGTFGLVLAPTRELAIQIQQTLETFATPRNVRSAVLIGGVDYRYDAQALATYPQIIVATPGRLCDHLDRGNLWLDYIQVVVLDEADKMLDMGFAPQLSRIMEEVPKQRQTLLFSATIPPAVESLARRILHDPVRIAIGKPLSAAHTVEQALIWTREEEKLRRLQDLLRRENGTTIVFTRSKDTATRVWRTLHSAGFYDATFIHSDRPQAHREQALEEFKAGKFRILVATDVAGRGIHVEGVAHVVNYELPMEPEDYVHRIGRTGRAGASGKATSLVSPRDRVKLGQIERMINREIPALNAPPQERDDGDRGGYSGEHRGGGGRGRDGGGGGGRRRRRR